MILEFYLKSNQIEMKESSAEIYILEPALSDITHQCWGNKMPINVKCEKCNREGNLTTKKTKTREKYYEYYYVQHYEKEDDKVKWCYIGSNSKLPDEYRLKINDMKIKLYTTIHNKIVTLHN